MLDERDFAGFNSLYDWCSVAYVTGQKFSQEDQL